MRAVIILRLEGGSIGPTTESLVNWDGPMAMLPCLHQGNIDTKRKLYVEWGSTNTTDTSVFMMKISHILKCEGK